jgi:hypothetical protein
MSTIEDFHKHRLAKMGHTGEANFICCPHCKGEQWAVQCFSNGERPFINALVCISDKCLGTVCLTATDGVIDGECTV